MKFLVPLFLMGGVWCLLAQDDARPNFTGTWHLDVSKSEIHSKLEATAWAIRQEGDSILIEQQIRGRTESLKCATNGVNCKAKPQGESGEVMFYYNGPILVETDILGRDKDHVVKKRLTLIEDGKTMVIEVMHMSPQGPTEKWVFARQAEVKAEAKP